MSDNWTVESIGDLTGKVIIVTGANSGLGYEASKIYAEKGAEVILAVRSLERGVNAKKEIQKSNRDVKVTVMKLDLSSLKSVEEFSVDFKEKYDRLDILMNNAGIMYIPYGLTEDGFERQIGVNHLGHFALTSRLFEVLKNTPESRIVNISSVGHRSGVMDFDNFLFENGKGYTEMNAYGRSKLANLLFTYELQRRVEKAGLDMKVLAAHPGGSNTNLFRTNGKQWWYKILMPVVGLFLQSAYDGSLPGVRASVDPDATGGTYYGPDGFGESRGKPVLVESNEASHNLEDAKKLWTLSEEFTKLKFEV